MAEKKKKHVENDNTTGHEWDGIKEYRNPDPLWLRYLFYATLFFSLGYWFLYPSWPGQHNEGAINWTSSGEADEGRKEIEKRQAKYLPDFRKASYDEILKNKDLLNFALVGGKFAFNNNCAVCHGAGGGGNPGYPNLASGAWLWGGKPEDIERTIMYGIRSGHEEARDSQMAAFGKDGILKSEQINLLVDYVIDLHKGESGMPEAAKLFAENCASCHGNKGQGNREVGAPALNDAIWLYGNSKETVYDVIYNGRGGVMPFWTGKLSSDTIKQLVVYVHQLGGGETGDMQKNSH